MDNKKLVIPKGDGTLEMAISSLEIYYQENDWVSNEKYKKKLIEKYPEFKNKDKAFLLHKGRTARYFGLIEYLYKSVGSLSGSLGKITISGKRFYEAYTSNNNKALIDTIMDNLITYTYGRNNFGVQGNSDVEVPAALLKSSLDLDYITKDESVILLYNLHDNNMNYENVIKEIKKQRSQETCKLPDNVPESEKESIFRRYGDNKAAQLMRQLGIFINDTGKYELKDAVKDTYSNFIKSLKVKRKADEKNYQSVKSYNNIANTIQKIFYGPPGTGKSYTATKLIQAYYPSYGKTKKNSEFVYTTAIHPDYSYYDFIGNVMPVVKKEVITYKFKPGIFTKALEKALSVEEKTPVFLVIEEMSRGNIASIFGDIFQLLDRDEYGQSEYSIKNELIAKYLKDQGIEGFSVNESEEEYKVNYNKDIYLPCNLNVLGTLNTSDQNVFVMDTAFKRRFEFEYMDINPDIDEETGDYLNNFIFELDGNSFSWINFYQKLNQYIVVDLEMPEDKQIGQFFIKFDKNTFQENYNQLTNKLLQYLWEDIHLITISESKLFNSKYDSFSYVYQDFKEQKNVFSNMFMEKFEK